MSDPNAIRTVGKSAVTPDRMALLHTLAFSALRLCAAQLDAFTLRLEEVLASRAADVAGAEDRELFSNAQRHLGAHRGTFQRLVADCLQRELMQAVHDAAEHARSGIESGAMDLSLITFDAMERKVIIDNLSQAIDRAGEEELAVLSLRIAHVLGADDIGSSRNPFRSAVFLTAAAGAWSTFDPSEATHRLVLRQMGPQVFLQLLPVWQALNQDLALRHVLPEAELLHRQRTAPPQSMPSAPAGEALRQWLAPEGMLKTIDVRADRLADEMLTHLAGIAAVPMPVRQLLLAVKTPLKQAALDDPQFFFDPQHPVRRMLESFFAAGFGCRHDKGEDLLLRAIEALSARIPSAALAQYKAIADAFDALAAKEGRIAEARLHDAIAVAVSEENVSQAERRAEEEVHARMESGEVEPFLESFLQMHWKRVLVFAYGLRDVKPEVLRKVLTIMDELLWSARLRQGAEERKVLVERLPALLSMLNAWLNVVKWEGPDRAAFFDTLAERHAAAMRGADNCSRRALEQRMDTVQRASEHQLARRAEEQRSAAFAPFMQEIDNSAPGTWFEFVRNDGGKVNCKLCWISPGGSRFVFSGRQGQLVFTLDREGLALGMSAGRVARLPAGELVSRAISAAWQKLAA